MMPEKPKLGRLIWDTGMLLYVAPRLTLNKNRFEEKKLPILNSHFEVR